MVISLAMGGSARWRKTVKLLRADCELCDFGVSHFARTVGLDGFCAWMRGPLAARWRAPADESTCCAPRATCLEFSDCGHDRVKRRGHPQPLQRPDWTEMWISIRAALAAPCSNFRCPTEGYVPNMRISAYARPKCEQNSKFDLESCCIIKVESRATCRVRNPGCVKEVPN